MNITINNNSNNNSHITIDNSTSLADLIKALGNVEEQEKTPTPKKLRETAGDPVAKEEGCLFIPIAPALRLCLFRGVNPSHTDSTG